MKIYKLENIENGMTYIGRTNQQYLWTRKGQHKWSALNNKKPCSSKLLNNNYNDYTNIKKE